MRIECLQGPAGMYALIRAFDQASQDFELGIVVATLPGSSLTDCHLLFTIGDMTAALTVTETRWLAEKLINEPPVSENAEVKHDFQRFGRVLLSVAADVPGPHGVH